MAYRWGHAGLTFNTESRNNMQVPPAHWFYKENIAAFLSWTVFSYIQLRSAALEFGVPSWQLIVTAVCLLWFILLFFSCQQRKQQTPWMALIGMWLLMSVAALLVPSGFAPGFGVLWVCLLPWFVPQRFLYFMLIPSLLPVAVAMALDGFSSNEAMMLLVCGTFQFFAIFAMSKAREENIARESLALAHEQLLQAQTLLASQAADAERLRISRDLHDSLGHHLTGLVIQLQVASYQAAPEQKAQLQLCQQQAKQLLHDIRHTVSQLRAPQHPQLALQLKALQQSMPDLTMELRIPAGLPHSPLANAVLFRVCQEALTNSRRHGKATHVTIEVWQHQQQVFLRYQDDGQLTHWPLEEGNGLTGMRERVLEAGGQILLSTYVAASSAPNPSHDSLQIDVNLPDEQGAVL